MPKRHHIVPTKGKLAIWRLKISLMVMGNLNKGKNAGTKNHKNNGPRYFWG